MAWNPGKNGTSDASSPPVQKDKSGGLGHHLCKELADKLETVNTNVINARQKFGWRNPFVYLATYALATEANRASVANKIMEKILTLLHLRAKALWLLLIGLIVVILFQNPSKQVALLELEVSKLREQLHNAQEMRPPSDRFPQSQPTDERQRLPHWNDWSAQERRATIAKAAVTTKSRVAVNFPAGYPGSKFHYHEPTCGVTIKYSNPDEASPSMIKWINNCGNALKVAAERLFHKRGRKLLNSLDIGPLHMPTLIPRCKAYFLDRLPLKELRKQYPDLSSWFLTDPDYLDAAETLAKVPDNSIDVVIMSHVLEHTRQPLRALRNAIRVATKDAVIYVAIPNQCVTFDKLRLMTPWSHHVEEWFDDELPGRNEFEHHREFGLTRPQIDGVKLRFKTNPAKIDAHAKASIASNYSIHYHTWTQSSFDEFMQRAVEEIKFPVVVQQIGAQGNTIYALLRRL